MDITLTDKQEKGLKLAVERYKHKEAYTCIAGYAGTGKAQPVDTLIPTPNGHKRLGDIQVGDYVFDRLGRPTKVLGVYPQGELDCYKVTLSDGRTTYCNDQHLWSCYNPKLRSQGKLIDYTLSDIIKNGLFYESKNNSHVYKYKIPVAQAVEFQEQNFDVDPYVVGAFLGDGCCKQRQLMLSSADEEIIKEVAHLLNCKSYHKQSEKNYNWTFFVDDYDGNGRKDILKLQTKEVFKNLPEICRGALDKDIPSIYMYSSKEQRLSLIQGLMDTDGCITKANGRYNVSFCNSSLKLIKSVQQVLLSLGFVSRIIEDKRIEKYTNHIAYELHISISNKDKYKLFRLSRKKNIALEAKHKIKHRDYSVVSIIKIEKCNYQKEMVCIYVDNLEHLYLTNDYIVTHNTTLVNHIINELNIPDKYIAYVAYTGKASLVLQQKGCPGATTAHKLLYNTRELPDGTFIHIPKDRPDKPLKLIIVDEVSMIEKEQWEILMRWRIPVIALGDPFQLPPIHDDNGVLEHPHIFLDQVMRQAQDSEIIRLSMDIREGKSLVKYKSKDLCVIPKNQISDQLLLKADQVLCGKNATRFDLNKRIRKAIWKDLYQDTPIEGDKVICLKNYWDYGNLTNGTIGTLNKVVTMDTRLLKPMMLANFESDTGEKYNILNMDYKIFTEGKTTVNQDNWQKFSKGIRPMEFDYGYAITVHKSQGSEFDKVILFNEYLNGDRESYLRWLYTGCTRASKKLIIGI